MIDKDAYADVCMFVCVCASGCGCVRVHVCVGWDGVEGE